MPRSGRILVIERRPRRIFIPRQQRLRRIKHGKPIIERPAIRLMRIPGIDRRPQNLIDGVLGRHPQFERMALANCKRLRQRHNVHAPAFDYLPNEALNANADE